ncbi:hypothetical protein BS47DRAFT_3645 [Hydnum rufescens UP504]|uniref:Uncharacterized protein n=1 Tax=Hydnum rufescens UP504 TaxID=1448309 RepID=A0A9P6BBG2_9AGAM|nr:hypothetical protein BS47DRAFT_3645 [Hydnum rufescens UP504]
MVIRIKGDIPVRRNTRLVPQRDIYPASKIKLTKVKESTGYATQATSDHNRRDVYLFVGRLIFKRGKTSALRHLGGLSVPCIAMVSMPGVPYTYLKASSWGLGIRPRQAFL